MVLSAFWMLCPALTVLREHGDADIYCTDVLVDVTLLNDSESLGLQKAYSS